MNTIPFDPSWCFPILPHPVTPKAIRPLVLWWRRLNALVGRPLEGRPQPGRRLIGLSLLETVTVVALMSSLLVVAVPAARNLAAGVRVRLACGEVAAAFAQARLYAIRHQKNVAVKFQQDREGHATLTIYRDGDGDGVLARDIARGIDPPIRPAVTMAHLDRQIRFGFPPGEAPRHPGGSGRRVLRLRDPIKFNRSDMASFDPLGTATPGTVYITDGVRHLAAVRVDHRSGKVSILRYDKLTETWAFEG